MTKLFHCLQLVRNIIWLVMLPCGSASQFQPSSLSSINRQKIPEAREVRISQVARCGIRWFVGLWIIWGTLSLILNCMWGCAEGENTPEVGLIIQSRVKAPVRVNGLDIFRIEAITGMTSAAPPSHILSSITQADHDRIARLIIKSVTLWRFRSCNQHDEFNYTV